MTRKIQRRKGGLLSLQGVGRPEVERILGMLDIEAAVPVGCVTGISRLYAIKLIITEGKVVFNSRIHQVAEMQEGHRRILHQEDLDWPFDFDWQLFWRQTRGRQRVGVFSQFSIKKYQTDSIKQEERKGMKRGRERGAIERDPSLVRLRSKTYSHVTVPVSCLVLPCLVSSDRETIDKRRYKER